MQQTDEAWPLQQEVEGEVDAAYRWVGGWAGWLGSRLAWLSWRQSHGCESKPLAHAHVSVTLLFPANSTTHRFIIDREVEAPDRFQAIQSYRWVGGWFGRWV